MDGKWTFNQTEDNMWWNDTYNTKEEAEEHAKEYFDADQETMYIGQVEVTGLPIFLDVERIFEELNEDYGQDLCEYDGYLFEDVTDEQHKWLQERLDKLISDFYDYADIKSSWYNIKNVYSITSK